MKRVQGTLPDRFACMEIAVGVVAWELGKVASVSVMKDKRERERERGCDLGRGPDGKWDLGRTWGFGILNEKE